MKNSAGIFARLHPAKFLANSLRNLNQQKKVPLKGVGHKIQDNDLTNDLIRNASLHSDWEILIQETKDHYLLSQHSGVPEQAIYHAMQ